MPEPVSCHAPAAGSSVIQCDDITIGPEPPRPQQVEPHEGAAGARALVASHTPALVVRHLPITPAHVDIPYSKIADECTGYVIGGGIVVAAASKAHPALAIASGVKAGIDLAICIGEELELAQQQADEARAVAACRDHGETPVSIRDGVVLCESPAPKSVR